MNLQPQPRTDLVPHHPCLSYAPTDPQGRSSRPTDQSGHGPTLIRRHQLPGQELSEHQNVRPHRCHKQLKPIQLP
jgi:hypothetical protein